MAKTNFLTLNDLSSPALFKVLERAHALKNSYQAKEFSQTLKQHVLAMIFEKSSTRTRVSFEAGMTQLGGSAIFLSPTDTQLGRGEPLEDTVRVLSEMVSAVMIRTDDHNKLERFAEAATIPVINGLSDSCHPCQLLADVQTMQERFGDVRNLRVAWIGDGNNVCHSYLEAANIFEFNLTVAVPSSYKPAPEWVEKANGRVTFVDSPEEAVKGAQVDNHRCVDKYGPRERNQRSSASVQWISDHSRAPRLRGKRCLLPSLFTRPQGRGDL